MHSRQIYIYIKNIWSPLRYRYIPYLPSCNFVKRLEGRRGRGIPRRSHCEAKAFPVRCRSSCNLETVGENKSPENGWVFIHRSSQSNTWHFYLPPNFSRWKFHQKDLWSVSYNLVVYKHKHNLLCLLNHPNDSQQQKYHVTFHEILGWLRTESLKLMALYKT